MIRKLTFAFISVLFVLNFSCTSSNVQGKSNSNNQNSLINNENFNSSISVTDSDVNEIVSKTSETKDLRKEKQVQNPPETEVLQEKVVLAEADDKDEPNDEIKLLFAGDIMAHTNNYHISSFDKIWRDVKYLIDGNDLVFANIEAPIDTTKPVSNYPNFNMPQNYVQAAVDAGFNVFSLCNNHSNDQYLDGIKETLKTVDRICEQAAKNANPRSLYFSGLKKSKESEFTYNLIEKSGWKILFLPMTELLNRPDFSEYINYVKTDDSSRNEFIDYVKKLREKNPCTIFILSFHTAEPEYTRNITSRQEKFYKELIKNGVDIIWANHAHIIKNRKIIVDTETNCDKLIMYANGNTISGQRRNPDLTSKNPNGERDNTGDGLFYKVTLKKDNNGSVKIKKCEPIFITTYINTANEFVLKPLNQDFVNYLYSVPRTNWAKYIERRININQEATKDLIEWQ
ncbi:MAG: CapA family protein [Spirochaetales bacterium]|nr:CapA family protein [Spirochaetales bacterium]MDY5913748.1 CapA family protein [Treponema sp.]